MWIKKVNHRRLYDFGGFPRSPIGGIQIGLASAPLVRGRISGAAEQDEEPECAAPCRSSSPQHEKIMLSAKRREEAQNGGERHQNVHCRRSQSRDKRSAPMTEGSSCHHGNRHGASRSNSQRAAKPAKSSRENGRATFSSIARYCSHRMSSSSYTVPRAVDRLVRLPSQKSGPPG
jgi:hypothetical protein